MRLFSVSGLIFPSMLLIGLLLLASSVQAGTEHVTVTGNMMCNSGRLSNRRVFLLRVNVQLKEYDIWPLTDDVLNNTKTDATGNFIISGSSSEWWGNIFFIEIKVPCWIPQTAKCNDMCTNPDCEYFVKLYIEDKYEYADEDDKKVFDLGDFNVIEDRKDEVYERYSMCP